MTWKVRQHKNGMYLVYDDENWYVMSCQDERRAQLVASAPKMLEVLEAILEKAWRVLESAGTPTWADWESVRGNAHAAIAAAKGESDEDELV